MAKPEFKDVKDVKFKPAESVADWLGAAHEPSTQTPIEPEFDWAPIPTVSHRTPFNGAPVLITSDGVKSDIAVWKQTRELQGKRFVPTAFWVRAEVRAEKIGYAPIGWKPYAEPAFVAPKKNA